MYSKLQYISQGNTSSQQLDNIMHALDAGCNWIQLRFKNVSEKELVGIAEQVKSLCEKYKATFIINDHVNLSKSIDADGVHLGLQDTSPLIARDILGADKIIGGTANTIFDIKKRADEKCDYIGLGPFRFTRTKEKLSPVLGLEGYKIIMAEMKESGIEIPVYAIGGITLEDVENIMDTAVHGIAVSGIISNQEDKVNLVQQLNNRLYAIA